GAASRAVPLARVREEGADLFPAEGPGHAPEACRARIPGALEHARQAMSLPLRHVDTVSFYLQLDEGCPGCVCPCVRQETCLDDQAVPWRYSGVGMDLASIQQGSMASP